MLTQENIRQENSNDCHYNGQTREHNYCDCQTREYLFLPSPLGSQLGGQLHTILRFTIWSSFAKLSSSDHTKNYHHLIISSSPDSYCSSLSTARPTRPPTQTTSWPTEEAAHWAGYVVADCPAMSFVFVCWHIQISEIQISWVGRSTTSHVNIWGGIQNDQHGRGHQKGYGLHACRL